MADYSGVYVLENAINGKQYVGSAVNLRKRRNNHLNALRLGKHKNIYLQRAFNFYGEDTFMFKHIIICEKFELLRYEQILIDLLKPEYNMCRVTGSRLGTKSSPETKEKIRQAHLGRKHSKEQKEKMRLTALGRKFSPEIREKNRQAHLGKKCSNETKEKLRKASFGRKYSLETREKLRQMSLGHKLSEEGKEKLRKANLGRKHSPETKAKISASHIGIGKGKKLSPEHKEKMRQSALIRYKILRLQDEKE